MERGLRFLEVGHVDCHATDEGGVTLWARYRELIDERIVKHAVALLKCFDGLDAHAALDGGLIILAELFSRLWTKQFPIRLPIESGGRNLKRLCGGLIRINITARVVLDPCQPRKVL